MHPSFVIDPRVAPADQFARHQAMMPMLLAQELSSWAPSTPISKGLENKHERARWHTPFSKGTPLRIRQQWSNIKGIHLQGTLVAETYAVLLGQESLAAMETERMTDRTSHPRRLGRSVRPATKLCSLGALHARGHSNPR